jgi:hypothetical protein
VLRRAYSKTQYLTDPTQDQNALAEALVESSTAVRTRLVSRRLFNSFANEYQKGDFIIHFAGLPAGIKLAGAKAAIASAAQSGLKQSDRNKRGEERERSAT